MTPLDEDPAVEALLHRRLLDFYRELTAVGLWPATVPDTWWVQWSYRWVYLWAFHPEGRGHAALLS